MSTYGEQIAGEVEALGAGSETVTHTEYRAIGTNSVGVQRVYTEYTARGADGTADGMRGAGWTDVRVESRHVSTTTTRTEWAEETR